MSTGFEIWMQRLGTFLVDRGMLLMSKLEYCEEFFWLQPLNSLDLVHPLGDINLATDRICTSPRFLLFTSVVAT